MKVYLPSRGILGKSIVELRQPTIGDIRNISNFNSEDKLLQIQFTQQLIENVDLSKITRWDLYYLFCISAFTTQQNALTYTLKCSCGKTIKSTFSLAGKDITDLTLNKPFISKEINGKKYNFRLLSALDELKACEYAIGQEKFDEAYNDAHVALILGMSDFDKAKELDLHLYMSALAFDKICYHGINLKEKFKCSCGKTLVTNIEPNSSCILIDTNVLLNRFISISEHMSLDNFLSLTLSEYKQFVDILNARE